MLKNIKKIFFNHNIKNKDVYLVDPIRDKEFLIESIYEESVLAIDTEFDWRNTYFPKLSLLQIATEKKILLIDCLKNKNLNFLKSILEDNNKLIIFHSSRSDATVLYTNLNIKLKNIFDIQIADQIISKGEVQKYATLVNKFFYIELKKTETNSDWLKRPFTKEQLSYAADDVKFLIEIYKRQIKILNKKNLLEKTFYLSNKESKLGHQDLYISRVKKLKKSSNMVKKIFLWRESYAKDLNIPTSYIFKNNDLKKLAQISEIEEFDKEKVFRFFKKRLFAEDFIEFLKN